MHLRVAVGKIKMPVTASAKMALLGPGGAKSAMAKCQALQQPKWLD